jgi:hypothetical protein
MEFVAGLQPPLETQKQIEHAMSCALCSSRLKKVAEQFADDLSDGEEKFLSRLASADRDWQQRLARRMQSASGGETSSRIEGKDHRRFPFLRLGLAAASAAILLSALSWFAYFRPSLAVNRLLTLAYAEHRSNDLRMSGSRYAPVEAFRSGDATGFRRPTSLLSGAPTRGASKPDDPFWLDAKADLMEDNYVSALLLLSSEPTAIPRIAIRGDLASAYFLSRRAKTRRRMRPRG